MQGPSPSLHAHLKALSTWGRRATLVSATQLSAPHTAGRAVGLMECCAKHAGSPCAHRGAF